MLTRRDFLQTSPLLALAPTVPLFVARTAAGTPADKDRRVLVVVQLDGGNDALNTVVPFSDPNYAKLRPRLRVAEHQLLRLNDALGLHPSLKALDPLLSAGHLAVVPGVGYPNPSRSHFEGMAVWHTARLDPEEHRGYGWLGRALDPEGRSFAVGEAVPGALRGRRSAAVALQRADEVALADAGVAERAVGPADGDGLLAFVRRQAVEGHAAADKLAALARGREEGAYPATGLAERLKLVARLLKADLPARVFYALQPGYDTHARQPLTHGDLLGEFAGAAAAFFADLKAARLDGRVALLAFSEFGRTVAENGSGGTDHGTAGCVFLAGPGVRGGLAGTVPSLTDLDQGEPKMTTDFRRVYATVLHDWLGLPGGPALGGNFERMPLFRA